MTDLATEIYDINRIDEFVEYFFTLAHEPESHRSDFAMAVWESLEQHSVTALPTPETLAAVERVLINAQHLDSFCFDFCNQVIWCGNNMASELSRRWMFALDSLDHAGIGSRGVGVLKSLYRDK
ncbi:MAG: hypothetical protein HRU13_12255, partial [Phycisphaerales bacterium]|nr:hypothetical protein [Phycisphaerales bacterium]